MIELPKIEDLLKDTWKLRVMCATACGYSVTEAKGIFILSHRDGVKPYRTGAYDTATSAWAAVPRYHDSRDAMAEATDALSDEAHFRFRTVLYEMINLRHLEDTPMATCRAHYSVVPIDLLAAFLVSQGLART